MSESVVMSVPLQEPPITWGMPYIFSLSCHAPSEALGLVADAARVIGQDPTAALRPTVDIPSEWGVAGAVASDIISQTQGKASAYAPAAEFDNTTRRIATCNYAEQNFAFALGVLGARFFERAPRIPERAQKPRASMLRVVVNEHNVPVILQKNHTGEHANVLGGSIALSLEPVKVANIVWPPGMFVRLLCDTPLTDGGQKPQVVPAEHIQGLGPVRLSSYGLPPTERDAFAVGGKGNPTQAIRTLELDDFRKRARRAVSRA